MNVRILLNGQNMLTVEKIENGFIIRIEQPDGPEWSGEPKSTQVMGTDIPPEKSIHMIMKEHYFNA